MKDRDRIVTQMTLEFEKNLYYPIKKNVLKKIKTGKQFQHRTEEGILKIKILKCDP